MDENTIKTIKDIFDNLPEELRELIMSDYYQNTLINIGKKYQLNVEQLGILEKEVTMVLMGLTLSKDFENQLTRELGVDKEKGRNVAQEVSDMVFIKVRELLQAKNEGTEEESSRPITPDPLQSAGIEVTAPKAQIEFRPNPTNTDRDKILKSIENPARIGPERETEAPRPIHQQKLAGHFQIPKTETHYEEKTGGGPAGDPYREPI